MRRPRLPRPRLQPRRPRRRASTTRSARCRHAASARRARSSLWLTEPVGGPPQGSFLNAVVRRRDRPLSRGAPRRLPRDRAGAGPGARRAQRAPHPRRRPPLLRRRAARGARPRPAPPAPARAPLRPRPPGRDRPRCPPSRARAERRRAPGAPAPTARWSALYAPARSAAPDAFHYIAVEGAIGVGKTSVVERLAERLDANTVLEEWWQNPFLKAFYDGTAGVVLPGRAVLPPLPLPPAAGAHPAQPLHPVHDLRLLLREEQGLRLPEPRGQRAAHLREALLPARGERAPARPRGLPAGPHRGAAEAHPRARPARGEPPLRGVPGRGEPRLQLLLLPLHADPAPGGEHGGRGPREERRRTSTT